MATQFLWAVNSMSAYPEHEGEQDVVFQVAYVCSGSEDGLNAATYGSVDVTYEAGAPFTPYSELQLDQVLDWVYAALGTEGVAKAEADCQALIDAQKNPKTVTPPLPW